MPGYPFTLVVGVGFEKCGTTSVARTLGKGDPRFAVPQNKELFYFTHHYSENPEDYLKKFPIRPETEFLVDFTPSYIHMPVAIERIRAMAQHFPTKIVVCLRDPIQRAFSNYIHDIFYHHAHYDQVFPSYATTPLYDKPFNLTFEQALRQGVGTIGALYAEEMRHVYAQFEPRDILVLVLENDFTPEIFDRKLAAFLGTSFEGRPVLTENTGRRLPLVLSPDEMMRCANNRHVIDLQKKSVYIFLSESHGIACWSDVPDDAIARIIEASGRWSLSVAPGKAAALRQEYFQEDIAQVEELIGRELPEWTTREALTAHRWFGVAPVRQHKLGVHTAISIFGVNPADHPF